MAEFGRFSLVSPPHTSFIESFHVEIEVGHFLLRALILDYEILSKVAISKYRTHG